MTVVSEKRRTPDLQKEGGPAIDSTLLADSLITQFIGFPSLPLVMGLFHIATAIMALTRAAFAAPATPSAQYCDPDSDVCYSSSTVGIAAISYRLAIPNVTASPFDLILQIVAPKTAQWAGIAFGGHMINNTIAIGWANGNTSVVSSRWAS